MSKQFDNLDLQWAYKELAANYDEVCKTPWLSIEHVQEHHLFLQAQKLTYDLLFKGDVHRDIIYKSIKRVHRRYGNLSFSRNAPDCYYGFLNEALDYIREPTNDHRSEASPRSRGESRGGKRETKDGI